MRVEEWNEDVRARGFEGADLGGGVGELIRVVGGRVT